MAGTVALLYSIKSMPLNLLHVQRFTTDVYTSRVSNLLAYTPYAYYR